MAHFYGTMRGQSRKRVTRCGTLASGLGVSAANEMARIEVGLWHDPDRGQDIVTIRWRPLRGPHDGSTVADRVIYEGPLDEMPGVGGRG